MKITFITEYFPYKNKSVSGGVENRCFNLAKNLAINNDVTVITSWERGQDREYILEGVKIKKVGVNHKYTNFAGIRNNISRFIFMLSSYKEARKIKADIIDAQSFISSLPAYYAAKKHKAKSVYTAHEVWVGKWIKLKGVLTGLGGEIWERVTLKKNWDLVITVSETVKNELVKIGIKEDKIKVFSNGIDLTDFKKLEKYKEPTICSISRLTKTKKVDILIKSIKILKSDFPNIKCVVLGKGEEYENLKLLVKELNLEKNVFLEGYVSPERLKEVLSKSHLFCLPSTLEGFGIVLLESLASGTPYVCSNIDVLNEISSKIGGGETFIQNDPLDLSIKIKQHLSNKKYSSKKLNESKERLRNFDWVEITKKIENEYLSSSKISA